MGNCFCTKEEAQNAVEQLKIRAELQRYADEHNEDNIDWTNFKQLKYFIIYDYKRDEFFAYTHCYPSRYLFEIYFTSEEVALNAIKAIGEDRIKKYLFGVIYN